MEGLYVGAIVITGSLLVLVIWIWRCFHIPFSRQLEILFFLSGFVVWIGTMTGLYGPSQIPSNRLAKAPIKELAGSKNASSLSLSGSPLAYVGPESGVVDSKSAANNVHGFDRWTAVYEISSHTVYLPDGRKLEAHSGLGSKLDNPRYVHERMHGATPPHVYELALREKPFHGVRALRLKPIGGKDNIFGRSGLLAHTYMLGPNGDSNGCVVFKDYNAFLQAFESGEVKRLVVVANID
jgi:hypothetical protein